MFVEHMRESAYGAYRIRLEVLLHIPTDATDQDIHDLIEAGFSAGTVKTLFESGSIRPRARDQIIPLKTLKTRLARGQRLTLRESDSLSRVVHITAMAEVLFGCDERSKRWLSKSKSRFSGKSPIEMLSTTEGARQVEEMLIQVAEGLAF